MFVQICGCDVVVIVVGAIPLLGFHCLPGFYHRELPSVFHVGLPPFPVLIIVGWIRDPLYKPSFAAITGKGPNPKFHVDTFFLLPPAIPPSKTELLVKLPLSMGSGTATRATVGCKFHRLRSTSKGCFWDRER